MSIVDKIAGNERKEEISRMHDEIQHMTDVVLYKAYGVDVQNISKGAAVLKKFTSLSDEQIVDGLVKFTEEHKDWMRHARVMEADVIACALDLSPKGTKQLIEGWESVHKDFREPINAVVNDNTKKGRKELSDLLAARDDAHAELVDSVLEQDKKNTKTASKADVRGM